MLLVVLILSGACLLAEYLKHHAHPPNITLSDGRDTMAVKRRAPRSSVLKRPKVRKVTRKPGKKPRKQPADKKPSRTVRPRRQHLTRPTIPDPIPSPWSEAQLEKIIEQACRFIAGAKERCGRELGKVVGRYLFLEVYRGDVEYLRRNDPGKEDSLRDIARLSGVPYPTLYEWTMAAFVRLKLEEAGFDGDLSIKHLGYTFDHQFR